MLSFVRRKTHFCKGTQAGCEGHPHLDPPRQRGDFPAADRAPLHEPGLEIGLGLAKLANFEIFCKFRFDTAENEPRKE